MSNKAIDNFLLHLQEYHAPGIFNPWSDFDAQYDVSTEAPLIRSGNLRRYLELREKAEFIFLAEGLGYQGGHFSGMAMTSERILLGRHPTVPREAVLGEWEYRRTSNPAAAGLSARQREEGFNEPTATIMWGELGHNSIDAFKAVLWNIFPFHPHKAGNLLTNRTPTREELDSGIVYARELFRLFPQAEIIAIGRKAEETLNRYGISCSTVPHPSMGGANRFREAVRELLAKKK